MWKYLTYFVVLVLKENIGKWIPGWSTDSDFCIIIGLYSRQELFRISNIIIIHRFVLQPSVIKELHSVSRKEGMCILINYIYLKKCTQMVSFPCGSLHDINFYRKESYPFMVPLPRLYRNLGVILG